MAEFRFNEEEDVQSWHWRAHHISENAAGRVYLDQARARQVFSQAGVVAPPESLSSEIRPISGKII